MGNEEIKEIIELDQNNIENLDIDSLKKIKDDEINTLKKKLKITKVFNAFLIIFAVIFISLIVSVIVLLTKFSSSYTTLFGSIFSKRFNIASISQLESERRLDLQKFAEKLAFVDDAVNILYYYDKDNKKIQDSMFEGYLNALGDKYAQYFPAQEYHEFTEKTTEGIYYGIGCLVSYDKKTNENKINMVYEDSPAEKGGLKEGDVIVSIDGTYVRDKSLDDIVALIKGPEGTERHIEVYRESENTNVNLVCFCGKVDIKLINSKIYEDEIGYIDIDEFTGKAYPQFVEAIDKITEQNVKALILDCRSNVGGELDTVLKMLDYLLRDTDGRFTLNREDGNFEIGKTLLVYIKEKNEIVDSAYCDDKHQVNIPMVVLTDFGTASAAELFSKTLQDYKKAELVGTKTYGKGVVQTIIPCDDGSAIKFTVSEYFPASGYTIDKIGVMPDYSLGYDGVEVEYDDDKNVILIENNTKYIIDSQGSILSETPIQIATESEISTQSEIKKINNKKPHVENLKIYDDENEFLNEDWYAELDNNYEDKQLLQAIVILKDKIAKITEKNKK